MNSALDMKAPESVAASIGEAAAVVPVTTSSSDAVETVTTGSTSQCPSDVTSSVPLPAMRPTNKSKKKKGPPPASSTASTAIASGGGVGADTSLALPGENTGRWMAEEHRLFLQGLEQHGKGWKKIASLIKSRTVVQIRTHAQKYFQKLAKARQNGDDENAVTFMEGRGGTASVTSASTIVVAPRRRRQVTGTKRKVLQSIVASAQREEKKHVISGDAGVPNPFSVSIAPALAYFVVPGATGTSSIDDTPASLSGAMIEDSLFRFLTPCPPIDEEDMQVNDVARQAGANPITLPPDNRNATIAGGEISPTGVNDISIYPSWSDAKETPSWYAKGADVDCILDVADTLDWLADTGDLNEIYVAPQHSNDLSGMIGDDASETGLFVKTSTSVSTLPHVESNMETMVPTLPSLFDNEVSESGLLNIEPDSTNDFKSLHTSVSGLLDSHLQVFDSPIEEHAFVSTILEDDTNEDAHGLPSLG